jgi:hypothetical protein
VPLTSHASEISAFVTPDNFLQYFLDAERLVKLVAGVPNCSAYLDDLVIYSSEWSDHVDFLRVVCERLAAASLTLNLASASLGRC